MDVSLYIATAILVVLIACVLCLKAIHLVKRFLGPGTVGELTVARYLKKLPDDKYKVINDLLLQNNERSAQIDHVIISVYGIFVLETKNYVGDIYGGENSELWTQNIYGNRSEFRNPLWQNKGHITAIKNFLGDNAADIPFYNLVLFSPRANLKINRSLPVYYYKEAVSVIKSYTTPILTPRKVEKIYQRLLQNNITGRKERKEHIKVSNEAHRKRNESVSSGRCPICGGKLVLREGKFGNFYGCSNYPRCKYILNFISVY